jgi:hypothetical protein
MQVDAVGKNIKVIVFTNTDKPATGDHSVNIVVQSRGQAYHAQQGTINKQCILYTHSKNKIPGRNLSNHRV